MGMIAVLLNDEKRNANKPNLVGSRLDFACFSKHTLYGSGCQ